MTDTPSSAPSLKLTQTAREFAELRELLFPFAEGNHDALVDYEVKDVSATVTFRCSHRTRAQLETLAGRYQLSLSEFMRRVGYSVTGAYGTFASPVSSAPEIK